MTTVPTVLAVVMALAVGAALFTYQRRRDAQKRAQLRFEVDKAFNATASTRLPKQPEFLVSALTLVRAIEEFSSTEDGTYGLQATRLYRATPDSYVLFICSAGQSGYLKLLSRLEAARHVRTTPKVLHQEFPDMVSTVQQ